MASCGVIVVLSVVDLSLSNWIDYCADDAGLQSFTHQGRSSSYSAMQLNCQYYNISSTIVCGDFCANLRRLKTAGIVMLTFSCVSLFFLGLVLLSIAVLVFRLKYSKEEPNTTLLVRLLRGFLCTSTVLWTAGTVVYIYYVSLVNSDYSETELEGAADLAIALACMQIANMFFGNCVVNRIVKVPTQQVAG